MGNNQDRTTPEKLAEVTMRKWEHTASFADSLQEAFKTYSGQPDLMTEDVGYEFALIYKTDPQIHSSIEKSLTHLSDNDEIIAKMTQFYNNQATSKKSHPAAAIGSKLSQQNRRQRRPESSSSSD